MNGPDETTSTLPRRWPVWLALLTWALLLVLWLGRGRAPDLSAATVSHWPALADWLRTIALGALLQLLGFVPLGLLAVFCLPSRPTWVGRVALHWVPALGIACLLSLVVLDLERHGPPLISLRGLGTLALAWTGCFVGAWAAMALARGILATIFFVPQLLMLAAALAGGLTYLVGKAVAPSAATISMPRVGSAERRHLYDTFASKNPVGVTAPSNIKLELSASELNLLIAWALSIKGSPARMAVDLDDGRIDVKAAVPVEGRAGFIKLSVLGTAGYRNGALALHLDRLHIGQLQIPFALLEAISPVLKEFVASDERLRPVFARLRDLHVDGRKLAVTYTTGALPSGFVSRLFHDGNSASGDIAECHAQIANLLANAKNLPRNPEARFGAAVRMAFHFAEARSTAGRAVDENRAAVLALGIAIGHPDVERLMGDFLDDKTRRTLRSLFTGTTLRGRDDWPKHLFVSAALTVITASTVSDASGLLKEEKDAAGGSGFSFADLLADRAGTTFATVATQSEASARALQARLDSGFRVDDFFPRADGLPEGIQDADFQTRYGGVGGTEYRLLEDQIEQRIGKCAAYRAP
jgi:hypothetical protein